MMKDTRFFVLTAAIFMLSCGIVFAAGDSVLSATLEQAGQIDIGATAPSQSKIKDWTVMAFLNGNSNLEDTIQSYDIAGLEGVGTTDKVNVVAEMAYMSKKINQRLVIEKDTSTVVEQMASQNMGDYKHLADFITWVKTNYPAKRYMLLIDGHGSGWADYNNGDAPVPTKGMSYDSLFNSDITTTQFPKAFDIAGKVDVLVLKSCLMGAAEALYEARNASDMTIASEEILNVATFDYPGLLDYLNQTPDTTLSALGKYFIQSYSDQFKDSMSYAQMGQTLVSVNMGALAQLPAQLNAFTAVLEKSNEGDAVLYAQKNALNFQPSYGDLGDFAALVASRSSNAETKAACAKLITFIKNDLAYGAIGFHKDFNGQDYTRATGFSIEIEPPSAAQSVNPYTDLALVKATDWAQFIQKYYK
jgi:hypothetical protein